MEVGRQFCRLNMAYIHFLPLSCDGSLSIGVKKGRLPLLQGAAFCGPTFIDNKFRQTSAPLNSLPTPVPNNTRSTDSTSQPRILRSGIRRISLVAFRRLLRLHAQHFAQARLIACLSDSSESGASNKIIGRVKSWYEEDCDRTVWQA
jgi:hypothetical protein